MGKSIMTAATLVDVLQTVGEGGFEAWSRRIGWISLLRTAEGAVSRGGGYRRERNETGDR